MYELICVNSFLYKSGGLVRVLGSGILSNRFLSTIIVHLRSVQLLWLWCKQYLMPTIMYSPYVYNASIIYLSRREGSLVDYLSNAYDAWITSSGLWIKNVWCWFINSNNTCIKDKNIEENRVANLTFYRAISNQLSVSIALLLPIKTGSRVVSHIYVSFSVSTANIRVAGEFIFVSSSLFPICIQLVAVPTHLLSKCVWLILSHSKR